MNIWTPAFLHEFPDGNLANLRAPPGTLDTGSNPVVRPPPFQDRAGFDIIPGARIDYRFDTPFEQVIGIDVAVQFDRGAGLPADNRFGRIELGDGGVSLLFAFIGTTGRIQLGLPSGASLATSITLPPVPRFVLRVRWHTHGTAHISIDGALRHYEPGLAVGESVTIANVTLRHHSPNFFPGVEGLVVERLFVRLLRRDDAAAEIDRLLGIDPGDGLSPGCARKIAAHYAGAMREARQLMTLVLGRLTFDWREIDGTGKPFSDEAIKAHRAAEAAATALVRALRDGDDAARGIAISNLSTFIDIIAAAAPAETAALRDRLATAAVALSPECRAEAEALAARNPAVIDRLKPLFEPLAAAIDR